MMRTGAGEAGLPKAPGTRGYAFAKLGGIDLGMFRIAGPGLGNMLFPWARAVVACERFGLMLVSPTWPQLKVGPLLRGERDRRTYTGLFWNPPEQLRGAKRMLVLATAPRIPEATLANGPMDWSGRVVLFEGMCGLFQPLRGHRRLLFQTLVRVTRPEVIRSIPSARTSAIALHVRCGDFVSKGDRVVAPPGQGNVRTPMSWFVATLRAIRRSIGTNVPAHVFSDGTPDQLVELMAEPDCSLVNYGASIADLLAMSRYATLIGSNSTFSMWASFLGTVPTIWPPRTARHPLHETEESECEYGGTGPLSPAFVEAVRQALSGSPGPVRRVCVRKHGGEPSKEG